jgi:hypothetical protein
MQDINEGGSAFPALARYGRSAQLESALQQDGMTLRQYAAIKLKVPDSGTDWLDEMIVKSLRDYFAAKAMQATMARLSPNLKAMELAAALSYEMADEMIKAREAK